MLVPRFSLRSLLLLTTVAALVSFVVMCAVRGQAWAIALAVAMASLVLTLLLHAVFFLVAWMLSQPWQAPANVQPMDSGFQSGLPPQLIPPQDPE